MAETDGSKPSIEVSLVESIASPEVRELTTDILEITADAFLDDGLLKDFPIIGSIVSVAKTGFTIRDRIFQRKVVMFLREFSEVPNEIRNAFIVQLEKDAGTKERAGAALLLLLERMDDIDKPSLIGQLYVARLNNELSFDELRRFCMIVDRCHLPDLIALSRLQIGESVDKTAAPYLHALGLVSVTEEDYGSYDTIGLSSKHEINEYGQRFLSTLKLT